MCVPSFVIIPKNIIKTTANTLHYISMKCISIRHTINKDCVMCLRCLVTSVVTGMCLVCMTCDTLLECLPADVKGIPDFWLTVLLRHEATRGVMNEKDPEVLRYLSDIQVGVALR